VLRPDDDGGGYDVRSLWFSGFGLINLEASADMPFVQL